MARSSDPSPNREDLRARILGFGEQSQRKTYYPELRQKLQDLERFRQLLDYASESVIYAELPSGQILDANLAAAQMAGLPRESLVSLSLGEFLPADAWTRILSMANLDTPSQAYLEQDFKDASGTIIPVETTIGRCVIGDTISLILISRDISRRRQTQAEHQDLERRLRQAEKLEALGTLAGGIAHDFNNILSSLLGYAQLAREDLPDDLDQIRTYLQGVERAGHRATALVQQILTLARHDDPQVEVIQVAEIVREASELLRGSLPSTISIELDLPEDTPPVMVDPAQLHQVIMNLSTNAFHAMQENGGTLTIGLQTLITPPSAATTEKPGPGCWTHLTVSDTGRGIPQTVLARVFDPYFTTKAVGEGTGLGLSTVHGIITGYGGHVSIISNDSQGTTVNVYLPSTEVLEDSRGEGEVEPVAGGNGEHLMVVDDEAEIVRLLDTVLTRQGYLVTAADSATTALEALKNTRRNIDLVICDQTMPGCTGLKLTADMRSLIPDIPVILCSGRTDDQFEEQVREAKINSFLLKPVSMGDLLKEIRSQLDSAAGPD